MLSLNHAGLCDWLLLRVDSAKGDSDVRLVHESIRRALSSQTRRRSSGPERIADILKRGPTVCGRHQPDQATENAGEQHPPATQSHRGSGTNAFQPMDTAKGHPAVPLPDRLKS